MHTDKENRCRKCYPDTRKESLVKRREMGGKGVKNKRPGYDRPSNWLSPHRRRPGHLPAELTPDRCGRNTIRPLRPCRPPE